MKKIIIGLTEKVRISGKRTSRTIIARIDTGATRSSIDAKLAALLQLGPVIKTILVKSAHGNRLRPVIKAPILIARKDINAEFTIADREHMKYKALIGQNVLKKGFLINPDKK
ncbi:RimK/LysX family protein [Candidatus Woesearchaeota archaeon]|nr:RimK/LysX family protein [Candidatus Woesearchaeota archaeon]